MGAHKGAVDQSYCGVPLPSCSIVQNILLHPDERQLTRGIKSTDVPARLQSMVDSLVWESTRTEEGYVWMVPVAHLC